MKKLLLILLFFVTNSFALNFSSDATYKTCFTPSQNCTQKIVDVISSAKNQILVQAYSFTSIPIAEALAQSEKNGVDVQILLDKSQRKAKNSVYHFFKRKGLSVKIDYKPAIAHNKIMIIDKTTVVTGSFNFTNQAQKRNAENLLIITDKNLAQQYVQNWKKRAEVSF